MIQSLVKRPCLESSQDVYGHCSLVDEADVLKVRITPSARPLFCDEI